MNSSAPKTTSQVLRAAREMLDTAIARLAAEKSLVQADEEAIRVMGDGVANDTTQQEEIEL
jgi:hypothetical protein